MRCSFLIRHRRRSLPVFLQHGATDCAETCLAMVSCYHGRAEKSIRLSLQSNAGSSAWSLRMLVEQARRLNFETRPWALGSEELDRLTLPCILHLQHGHYVVLVALSSAHAVIHDPALGRHRLNHDQLSTAFSGVALELTPDPEFESTPKTPTCSWRSFLPRRDPTVRVLRALGFGNLMLQLPALISPLLFQQVIDAALFEGDSDALRYSFAALVALMLLDTAGAHFLAVQQTEAELRLRRHSERRLCARWLRLPTAFFDLIPSSALLARFDALASLMRETLLLHTLGPAHLLCAIGALALAASYSLPIALLCVGTALLPPILHRVQFQRTQGLVDEHLRDRSRSRHSLLETLDHLPALHAQGTAGARRRLWQQLQHSELTASALQSLHGHRLASASRLCTNAGELLLLAALVALLATQALSLGSVVALQRYRSLAQHRLALLGDLLLRRQFAHIDRRYLDAIEPELSAPSADPG
ncbi:MAG: cysteine peptidase family C39 domain-containing protein, partial [Pseudomonadota bacterium]